MPPSGKLSQDDLETLREWVKLGAPWPAETNNNLLSNHSARKTIRAARRNSGHFVRSAKLPRLPSKKEKWVRSPIDRFILARLEAANYSLPLLRAN